MDSRRFHEFLQTRLPWRIARLCYVIPGRIDRLLRRIRYRRMPKDGWGKGWRVLVFRRRGSKPELHVLAPVDGQAFDWDLLRRHVRGEPWPDYARAEGVRTGVMSWAGHHIGVILEDCGFQRIPMEPLIPGLFRGGVDVALTLVDVRDPGV